MDRLTDMPCLFIDAQTTGAAPPLGKLLELAWGFGDGVKLVSDIGGALVQPEAGVTVPPRILKMVGRSAAELAAGAGEAAVYEQLAAALAAARPAFAVAHFASFEARFLADLWQRHAGAPWPLAWFCTHAISRRLFPDLPSLSLRALAGHFGCGLEPVKHASAHARATAHIWRYLCAELELRSGITTRAELEAWLQRKAPAAVGPRRYLVPRADRLALPSTPGIYRMVASDGRILYVGKATSLKARVNSYFRQRRGDAPAKREMLAQAALIETVVCATALEAALLETDEIKRHDPPYNVALKAAGRSLGWRDESLAPVAADGEVRYGPYARPETLDPLLILAAALTGVEVDLAGAAALLYDEVDPDVVRSGLELFAEEHGLAGEVTPRRLLATGLWLVRRAAAAEAADKTVDKLGGLDDDPDDDAAEQEDAADAKAEIWTPESVADSLTRLLFAAAHAHCRTAEVRRLLDSTVAIREAGHEIWRRLVFRGGKLIFAESLPDISSAAPEAPLPGATQLDISTYDRMRVLGTELRRAAKEGADVRIHT